ncbi:MAG: transposase [Pseudomonadota bacterium]
MARSIRLDYPDSYYHVLSRGNDRRAIYRQRSDYEKFLELLEKTVKRYRVEIHGYVLMGNHFHLLLKTREANLSRAVQWHGVSYAGFYNRKYNRSGHLFQGRFKSFLVEDDRYLAGLCYYIHGNPVRAGIVKDVESFEWSSYHGYASSDRQAEWLTTEVVLGVCGGSRKKFMREQEAHLRDDITILENLYHGLYLGSEEFADECAQRIREESGREKPQARQLLRGRDLRGRAEEVVKQLGDGDAESVLRTGRRKGRPVRDLAMYALSRMSIYTNKEIGEIFGVGYTAVTEAIKRAEQHLEKNKRIAKQVKRIIDK